VNIMAVEPLVTPLLRVPIFQGLSPLALAKVARLCERIVYRPGAVIARSGEPADAAILIVTGEAIRLEDARGVPAQDEAILPGTLVSELAMLIEIAHTASVVARDQVRALRVPRQALNALLNEEPDLAGHFLDRLTARLMELGSELRRVDRMLDRQATAAGPLPPPLPQMGYTGHSAVR
jgi:CRP-like cAMP-binding protein